MSRVLNLFHFSKKQLAVLIDPDKITVQGLKKLALHTQQAGVDFFFVGGSLLTTNQLETSIKIIKDHTSIPVVLFPGNTLQMSSRADAILFLSLISGRNAEMLIGRHVISAPYLKLSGLEVIPTGYMLIDSGKPTAVSYMSNSIPIPADKTDIAVCTAMAGEMLGLKIIYMDAGSGAEKPIKVEMISAVKQSISVPLVVGGGIRSEMQAKHTYSAGADLIVVGNAIEKDPELVFRLAQAREV